MFSFKQTTTTTTLAGKPKETQASKTIYTKLATGEATVEAPQPVYSKPKTQTKSQETE